MPRIYARSTIGTHRRSIGSFGLRIVDKIKELNRCLPRSNSSAMHVARFNCGPFRNLYSVVQRATMIDADGEKSNTIDLLSLPRGHSAALALSGPEIDNSVEKLFVGRSFEA